MKILRKHTFPIMEARVLSVNTGVALSSIITTLTINALPSEPLFY